MTFDITVVFAIVVAIGCCQLAEINIQRVGRFMQLIWLTKIHYSIFLKFYLCLYSFLIFFVWEGSRILFFQPGFHFCPLVWVMYFDKWFCLFYEKKTSWNKSIFPLQNKFLPIFQKQITSANLSLLPEWYNLI